MTGRPSTDEVLRGIDLRGHTAVVTGASSGLGLETARTLAAAGCTVVAAVRDPERMRRALNAAAGGDPADRGIEVVELDLAHLDSVRAAAAAIAAGHSAIDLLINNAGVMAPPLTRTAQGFELQLGTNHLGHFVLTVGLLDRLGAGARIVNLSSRGHRMGGIRWTDPHYRDESGYDKWQAYGQSKTANVLFTVELERRFADRGIHAFAVHPGVVATDLARHLGREDFTTVLSGLAVADVRHGAATTVWAATSVELQGRGGLYLEDCRVAGPASGSQEDGGGGYAPYAMDPGEAARLWSWSEEQVRRS